MSTTEIAKATTRKTTKHQQHNFQKQTNSKGTHRKTTSKHACIAKTKRIKAQHSANTYTSQKKQFRTIAQSVTNATAQIRKPTESETNKAQTLIVHKTYTHIFTYMQINNVNFKRKKLKAHIYIYIYIYI